MQASRFYYVERSLRSLTLSTGRLISNVGIKKVPGTFSRQEPIDGRFAGVVAYDRFCLLTTARNGSQRLAKVLPPMDSARCA